MRYEYKNIGLRHTAESIVERGHQKQSHGASEIFFFIMLLLLATAVILTAIFH